MVTWSIHYIKKYYIQTWKIKSIKIRIHHSTGWSSGLKGRKSSRDYFIVVISTVKKNKPKTVRIICIPNQLDIAKTERIFLLICSTLWSSFCFSFLFLKWLFANNVRNRKYSSLNTTSKNFLVQNMMASHRDRKTTKSLSQIVERSCVSKNEVIKISGANQTQIVSDPM